MKNLIRDLWAELGRAKVDSKHPWRYLTMATTGDQGPEQRMLVLRDYNSKEGTVTFFSDFRSAKIQQIAADPRVSLHAYHPRKRWQLRIKAELSLYHQDELAQSYLKKIPFDYRSDYQSYLSPGSVLKETGPLRNAEENFTVLVAQLKSGDFLHLSKEGHKRYQIDFKEEIVTEIQA